MDVIKKEEMGSTYIDILAQDNDPEIVWKAVQQITAIVLGEYLKRNGVRQFIPLKKPTFVWAGEVLEVCYYHDSGLYNKKFSEFNAGYIMQNRDPLLNARLEDLCRFYNLNPADYI